MRPLADWRDDRRAEAAKGPALAFDPILMFTVLALLGIGLVMVYSASVVAADRTLHNGEHYLTRQAINGMLGLVTLAAAMAIPVGKYRAWAPWMLLGALVLLSLLLIPGVGITVNRSTRWLGLGPIRLQPSEFAKCALIVFLAWSLERKGDRIREFKLGWGPPKLVLMIMAVLCLRQPDFGTTVMLSGLMLGMLYAGGAPLKVVAGMCILCVPLGYIGILGSATRQARIEAWLHPFAHADGIGYHLVQSLRALGSGGITGMGLGGSRQKLFFLPEAHTDFILAVIGEEFGFIGVVVVCLLFFTLLVRGTRATLKASDRFSGLLAFGITCCLAGQAAWNMGVVTGALPTKGLTLPFVSNGGSSLLVCCWMAGVLLRISSGVADVSAPALHSGRPAASAHRPTRTNRRDPV
jgi:cell division protein FtsW